MENKGLWRLLLVALLAASLFVSLAEASNQGATEVIGFSKPPDDDVLGNASIKKTAAVETASSSYARQPTLRPRVKVSTVAILTFLMAVASGLGTIPFFFFELDDSWKGACNGVACGVMLAASFDLISEGQSHGDGTCVMIGILLGGLFIIVSQRVLDQFGDVKTMNMSGASTRRMVLIVAIMTLHSFGEGSGVGVSYAGPRGFAEGLLVTIAIAVHNVPEGMAVSMVLASQGVKPFNAMLWSIFTSLPQPLVAVPAFMFAGTFTAFLPLCTGFAAGCMIWIVFGEVMPEAIHEGAKGSHIATAATVSVAIMEWLSTTLQGLESPPQWNTIAPLLLSLLFLLGPIIGGILLLGAKAVLPLHSALLTGLAAGTVATLSLWQPLQFISAGKLPIVQLALAFASGAGLYALLSHKLQAGAKHGRKAHQEDGVLGVPDSYRHRHRESPLDVAVGHLLAPVDLGLSPGTRLTGLVTLALCIHSLAEGLMLGVATAPKSLGLGMRMLLPVAIHGVPRGVAAAAVLLGTGSGTTIAALVAAALSGMAGPVGAIMAMAAGMDYTGLNLWLTFACGFLLPAATLGLLPRAIGLDKRRGLVGIALGVAVVCAGFAATKAVCANTTYCTSAPEALT